MEIRKSDSLKTLLKTVLVMLVVIVAIVALPKIVSCILPFFFAWIISLIIKPVIGLLEKAHFNRRFAVIVSMLLVICVISGVLYGVSTIIVKEIGEITELLKDTKDGVPVFMWDTLNRFPRQLREVVADFFASLKSGDGFITSSAFKSVLPTIGGFAGKIPGALIFTVIFLMSVYFLSYDQQGFKKEIRELIPESKYKYLQGVKRSFSKACGGYIKAQLILMCIVFSILLIGFLVMDIKFALVLALAISLMDVIPVLGTGMFLNPWAVVCLLQGNYTQAAGLVALYVVILITRQFLEPRILSGQLGIHPIITLVSMYAGYKLIGIIGMIIGPLVTLIVINFVKIHREITNAGEVDNYGIKQQNTDS